MRKRETQQIIARQAREIAVLKAQVATLNPPKIVAPKPVPKEAPKAVSKATVKKVAAILKAKKEEAKAEESEPAELFAANEQRRGPLAVLTPEELAAKHGSVGYDDLVTPINDHDRDWKATSEKITAQGGYKYE